MASRARHLEQARQNRRIAQQLLDTWSTDPYAAQWAVTAAFYCALHCVEAYLADQGVHSLNHDHRNQNLFDPSLGIPIDVRDAYEQLKQWSQHARYDQRLFQQAHVRTLVVDLMLRQITDWAGLPPA
jgi:hypothetical protein